MPQTLDILFAILIAVVLPIWGYFDLQRLQRDLAAGRTEARARAYLQTILWQWVLAAGALALWIAYGRDWSELGFVSPLGWRLWLSIALTALAVLVLMAQWRSIVAATGEKRDRYLQPLGAQMELVKHLLPHDAREWRRFLAVAVTAGICEELLYRAYLIWFLNAFIGLWGAAIVSTIIFAAAHLYQGPRAAVTIIFVGAALTALYLLSRSIWLPILVHAVIDLTNGAIGYHVLKQGGASARESALQAHECAQPHAAAG
jgi:membrane protease YdiL (CAAX protease family)